MINDFVRQTSFLWQVKQPAQKWEAVNLFQVLLFEAIKVKILRTFQKLAVEESNNITQHYSQYPTEHIHDILPSSFPLIQSCVHSFPVPAKQKDRLHLFPRVVDSWFGHKLVVPPSVGQPQLSVDHVPGRSQSVTYVDALGPQIVLEFVGVLDVLQIEHYSGMALGRGRKVVLMKERPESVGVFKA